MASRARINPLSVLFVIGLLAYGLFTVNRHAASSKADGATDESLVDATGIESLRLPTRPTDDATFDDHGDLAHDDHSQPATPRAKRRTLAERFGFGGKRTEPEPTSYAPPTPEDRAYEPGDPLDSFPISRDRVDDISRQRTPDTEYGRSEREYRDSATRETAQRETAPRGAENRKSPDSVPYAISGRVIKIVDGDTIDLLLNDRQTVRLRLDGIDSPERGQPYSNEARKLLKQLCEQQVVYAMILSRDTRWNRLIADIYQQKTWVNGEMVKAGMAWHYKQYNDSPDLSTLEVYAQQNRLGLWRDARPIAPWDYRRLDAEQRSPQSPRTPRTVDRDELGRR